MHSACNLVFKKKENKIEKIQHLVQLIIISDNYPIIISVLLGIKYSYEEYKDFF